MRRKIEYGPYPYPFTLTTDYGRENLASVTLYAQICTVSGFVLPCETESVLNGKELKKYALTFHPSCCVDTEMRNIAHRNEINIFNLFSVTVSFAKAKLFSFDFLLWCYTPLPCVSPCITVGGWLFVLCLVHKCLVLYASTSMCCTGISPHLFSIYYMKPYMVHGVIKMIRTISVKNECV